MPTDQPHWITPCCYALKGPHPATHIYRLEKVCGACGATGATRFWDPGWFETLGSGSKTGTPGGLCSKRDAAQFMQAGLSVLVHASSRSLDGAAAFLLLDALVGGAAAGLRRTSRLLYSECTLEQSSKALENVLPVPQLRAVRCATELKRSTAVDPGA
jgi:hypothetical protein